MKYLTLRQRFVSMILQSLAAEILGCPVSFIEFMDADRQWFKSKYGLPEDVTETPRDIAICNTVVSSGNLLCVTRSFPGMIDFVPIH